MDSVQQRQTLLMMVHCGLHALEVTNLNVVANKLLRTCFNPISPGGGGADSAPWKTFLSNSKTAQDIKMKFSKFNPTLMGVILHIMTILINLRCCHGNLLFCYIFQDIGLILLKFGAGGIFGF